MKNSKEAIQIIRDTFSRFSDLFNYIIFTNNEQKITSASTLELRQICKLKF